MPSKYARSPSKSGSAPNFASHSPRLVRSFAAHTSGHILLILNGKEGRWPSPVYGTMGPSKAQSLLCTGGWWFLFVNTMPLSLTTVVHTLRLYTASQHEARAKHTQIPTPFEVLTTHSPAASREGGGAGRAVESSSFRPQRLRAAHVLAHRRAVSASAAPSPTHSAHSTSTSETSTPLDELDARRRRREGSAMHACSGLGLGLGVELGVGVGRGGRGQG